jgi:uncharacterized protein YceK
MKKIVFVIVILLLAGCSTVQEKVKPYAKTVADTVCALNDVERAMLRQEIDAITAPHIIRIECNGEEAK